jgi:3,4-dihydroxy 2-butanone 4-phosphate synthase/GTP cyclohydrolase II
VSEGGGVLIYLHQNATGFSLEKTDGKDSLIFHPSLDGPPQQDNRSLQRDIGIAAQILLDLKLRQVRTLTNHPHRLTSLQSYGIEIVEQLPIGEATSPKPDSTDLKRRRAAV